jgi:hypothetical protein
MSTFNLLVKSRHNDSLEVFGGELEAAGVFCMYKAKYCHQKQSMVAECFPKC